MSYDLETFYRDCRESLKADPGKAGQESVQRNVEKLLDDPGFCAAHLGDDAQSGIRTLYRDPEADFCVLIHIYETGKTGPPHDHGASWAVYGQVAEFTDMTRWKRTDGGTGEGHAEVEPEMTFRLEPGMAGKFGSGEIHSVKFPDGARFIRVTGTDLDSILTLRFDLQSKIATAGSRLK
jgi:predicted metal-dependent enzyme (double-stranded beta helix superfamily)